METQLELLNKAWALAEENPGIAIHFMVSDDIAEDNDWTMQKICKVEISPWLVDGDQVLTSAEEAIDHWEIYHDEEITEEEALAKMGRAIVIWTVAG